MLYKTKLIFELWIDLVFCLLDNKCAAAKKLSQSFEWLNEYELLVSSDTENVATGHL